LWARKEPEAATLLPVADRISNETIHLAAMGATAHLA
jgi:hypothetical protein